jgi:hypothetical protein
VCEDLTKNKSFDKKESELAMGVEYTSKSLPLDRLIIPAVVLDECTLLQ